jgi:hypothetical protein
VTQWFPNYPPFSGYKSGNLHCFLACFRQTRELFRKKPLLFRVENCKDCYVKTQLQSEIKHPTVISGSKVSMRTTVVRLSTQTYTRGSTIHNTLRHCFIRTSSLHTSFFQTSHSFLKYIWRHSNVRSNAIRYPEHVSLKPWSLSDVIDA